jgi:hypothetical protein
MDDAFTENVLLAMEYERQRKEPPEGFRKLPLIPGGRYTDPEFQQLELEGLWKKS